jgi:hypothetical protein
VTQRWVEQPEVDCRVGRKIDLPISPLVPYSRAANLPLLDDIAPSLERFVLFSALHRID